MRNRLARWFERRAVTLAPAAPYGWFLGGPTESGAVVSPQSALSVPAVFACCQVLSQDLARCPIKLRQKIGPDSYVDAVDHPLFEILHDLANPEMTAYQVKHFLMWQLLTYGRAYAEIVRVDGRVTALWPLDAARMVVDRDAQRRRRWTYSGGGRFGGYSADGTFSTGGPTSAGTMFQWTFDPSQPPILELTHESPILRCREIIGTALALQTYVAKFFANGAQPSGVLTTAGKLTPLQQQQLRESWQTRFAGASNAHNLAILTGGLEFKNTAVDNDSSQMAETMKALATAICGAFRVPPWKAGMLESTSYSNMESGERTYIVSTLDPLFESWEEALRRDVLTTRQYGSYTVQFDRSALARNDLAALNTSLQAGINAGYLSQNDCRRALGLNPIADGDVYRVNSALQPVGAPHDAPVA